MNRRVALKQVLMAAAAAALVPAACTWEQKKSTLGLKNLALDTNQDKLFSLLVDSIIPATDSPGAGALNVPAFALKMLDDCYEQNDLADVVKSLEQLEALAMKQLSKSFGDASANEREQVLMDVDKQDDATPPELQRGYTIVKRLTVQGYLTSQYFLTEIQHYEMVPGRFNGCFPVPSTKATT